jgi:hypothetical protein
MDAEKCNELSLKNVEMKGILDTHKQRMDSFAERLDELIDDVNDIKRGSVSRDSFNQLFHDVSKIRENLVDKNYMHLFMEEVRGAKEASKNELKLIKGWLKIASIVMFMMFAMVVGEFFLVMGAESIPILNKFVHFVFKVLI